MALQPDGREIHEKPLYF